MNLGVSSGQWTVGEALEAVAYAHSEACAAAGFAHAVQEDRVTAADAGVVHGNVGVGALAEGVVRRDDEEIRFAIRAACG